MYISYGDGHNVEVAGYLRGKLVAEYESYSESVINSMLSSASNFFVVFVSLGVVYRYYESTRQKHLDGQPGRLAAKERNLRNTKIRNRQKQVKPGMHQPAAGMCLVTYNCFVHKCGYVCVFPTQCY